MSDLFDIVLHDVVHSHLGQVQRLSKLILSLEHQANSLNQWVRLDLDANYIRSRIRIHKRPSRKMVV
jgi:hypothetical protein